MRAPEPDPTRGEGGDQNRVEVALDNFFEKTMSVRHAFDRLGQLVQQRRFPAFDRFETRFAAAQVGRARGNALTRAEGARRRFAIDPRQAERAFRTYQARFHWNRVAAL